MKKKHFCHCQQKRFSNEPIHTEQAILYHQIRIGKSHIIKIYKAIESQKVQKKLPRFSQSRKEWRRGIQQQIQRSILYETFALNVRTSTICKFKVGFIIIIDTSV